MNTRRKAIAFAVVAAFFLGGCGNDQEETSLAEQLQAQAAATATLRDSGEAPRELLGADLKEAIRRESAFMELREISGGQDGESVQENTEGGADPNLDAPGNQPPDTQTVEPLSFNAAATRSIEVMGARIAELNQTVADLTRTVGNDRVTIAEMIREVNGRLDAVEAKANESPELPVDDIAPHELMPANLDQMDVGEAWTAEIIKLKAEVEILAAQAKMYMDVLDMLNEAAPAIRQLGRDIPGAAPMVDGVLAKIPRREPAKRAAPKPKAEKPPPQLQFVDSDSVVLKSQNTLHTIMIGDSADLDGVTVTVVSADAKAGTASLKLDGRATQSRISA